MPRGAPRFLLLALTVLGLLGGLEAVCRVNPTGLAAIAHRVRFKLALLEAKGGVDAVTLGSSRSNDGVSPKALGLGKAFNAATPSNSLATLEFVAAHLGAQKLVLVEVSRPQMNPDPFDGEVAAAAVNFDGDPVGEWLHAHSALLPVRRAFALENLPRVYALLAPGGFDGSEWFRSRYLVEFLRSEAPPEGVQDDAAWAPVAAEGLESLDEEAERVVGGYARAVASLRAGGAKVVLVAPPLGTAHRVEECVPALNALRAEVARRTQAPLLDFTCAPVDDRWFVDSQHLSTPGRYKYSQVLGEAVRALP